MDWKANSMSSATSTGINGTDRHGPEKIWHERRFMMSAVQSES